MGLAQTQENPNQDVVTVAWSTVDVMADALAESDVEIPRLMEKTAKTLLEADAAQAAVNDAEARKIERQAALDAALAVLAQVSADNPELAAEALARR